MGGSPGAREAAGPEPGAGEQVPDRAREQEDRPEGQQYCACVYGASPGGSADNQHLLQGAVLYHWHGLPS